jgi:peptidoglycan/LPS O-acetylase OafA/YrhL
MAGNKADPSLHRKPGLDLMRAIAVLLVMLSHYMNNFSYWLGLHPDHAWFYSGDLGVSLFFALSGYLIGGILLDILKQGGGQALLQRFLIRRWMRTLPLYWFWLAVSLLVFPPHGDRLTFLLHFATMTQNLWGPMPPGNWFAVSWSLPIEEWFYILFGSAALLFVARGGETRSIWIPLVVFLVVPLALRAVDPRYLVFDGGHMNIVPLRLDEIAYGVLVVVLHRGGNRLLRHTRICMALGIGIVLTHWTLEGLQLPLTFLPVSLILRPTIMMLGCALCLPAAANLASLPRWLAWAARTVSRQSYALYLVHLTILVDVVQAFWTTHPETTLPAMAMALVLPFLVAELLCRGIEQPIMRLRPAQFPGQ